jgi:two-component system NtrC family sensor kinase
VAAFAVVLAALILALALQLAAFRRMEAAFDDMRAHEQTMALALQLEDAVRDQYGHEGELVLGERGRGDHERARARVLELTRELAARVRDPEANALMDRVREASAEIDRVLRERAEPSAGPPVTAAVAHERSYRLVSLVEENVDALFKQLQRSTSSSRQELVRLKSLALRFTATLLVVAPLLVAAAVVYLSRSIARPLARLGEGAAAVAGGDLDARIELDSPDEFGALASELNAMTAALKRDRDELVESEKLAGIGRLAAGVAHELNNPLQVIIGYLSFNRDVPDRRLAEQLAAVEDEALRCKAIVEDLLELSRPVLAPSPVDLRALCESVSDGLRLAGSPASPRLSLDGGALALADGHKVRQVVFNLMKNAAEAAGPAGDVSVRIASAGEMVEVAVSDSGPGIAPDARARLFEPFFTTKSAGTGLGLAVSRAIARAHGGDIHVDDGACGGAVFTLRLPRAADAMERSA